MQTNIIVFALSLLTLAITATTVSAAENEEGRRYGNFCSSCHGTAGAAVSDAVPTIGGQHKEYLKNALIAMKPVVVDGTENEGPRYSTLMKVFLKGYSEAEIEAMADWYASREWVPTSYPLDQDLIAKGKVSENLETCISCHGENGNNQESLTTPRIGGQTPTYLYHALLEYKNNKRNTENAAEMDIVKDISDEELRALAEYFSSLK